MSQLAPRLHFLLNLGHSAYIKCVYLLLPSKSVFAANNILLIRNSNIARSLWSLLCEMEDRDRFPELSESELTPLLGQKNSDNTKIATKVALNVFTEAKAAYGVMLLKQV